jgi:hypothetical protein
MDEFTKDEQLARDFTVAILGRESYITQKDNTEIGKQAYDLYTCVLKVIQESKFAPKLGNSQTRLKSYGVRRD